MLKQSQNCDGAFSPERRQARFAAPSEFLTPFPGLKFNVMIIIAIF